MRWESGRNIYFIYIFYTYSFRNVFIPNSPNSDLPDLTEI